MITNTDGLSKYLMRVWAPLIRARLTACACNEQLIGPWYEVEHSFQHCRALMPTGNPLFVAQYDVWKIPDVTGCDYE